MSAAKREREVHASGIYTYLSDRFCVPVHVRACSCVWLFTCVPAHVCAQVCRGQRMTALGKIFTYCEERSMSGSEHNLGS